MLVKDTAICLQATDFSETSQILTFFTKQNGKIRTIAKGSKRPKSAFDGPVEIFSFGQIVFSDTTKEKLLTLTDFEQKPLFRKLIENHFALNCAYFAAELTNKLTDDLDPHSQLFESLLQFLHQICDSEKNSQRLSFIILFQLDLLSQIGLQPVLNSCANCKNPIDNGRAYFSSSANGLLCKDCEPSFIDKTRLTSSAANCLQNIKTVTSENENTLNEIEKILVYHFTEILQKPPKMAKYILKN